MVHSNEMGDMGGLRKFMPVTHISFLIACLAISGIPPLSGFFSKEEILLAAFNSDKAVYIIGLLTSGLTAFYMFRVYFSVFWNKDTIPHNGNEGTLTMKVPLIILSVATVLAGFVPFSTLVTWDGSPLKSHISILFSIAPVGLAVLGILLAAVLYKSANERPAKIASALGGLYHAAYSKFYIDEIYVFVTRKIIFNLIGRPAAWIDRNIIDAFMNLLAAVTAKIAERVRGLQSGKIQNYTLYFFAGIVGLAVIFIYMRK
jgi:NADH-quinone oxidoreductase subunit L